MSDPQDSAPAAPSFRELVAQPKMAALLVLGFASGLPLYLTGRSLQAWMTVEGVDLTTIGLFSLTALPYSLKFLWAPVLDRYVPPLLGRRRGWIVLTQVLLLAAIAAMSLHRPREALQLLAFNAMLIALFSASQDIAFDAYRADVLQPRELGFGAGVAVLGYRLGLILAGSAAFILADRLSWPVVYLLLAGLMAVGVVAAIFAPEPPQRARPPETLRDAVRLPFRDFFARKGLRRGLLILAFINLYRLGDSLLSNLSTPFLLQLGFSQSQIGAVQGFLGLVASIGGVLVGGVLLSRFGINRSLWVFGGLQAASNLAYYALAEVGAHSTFMVGALVLENFCSGLGTAAFVAFLMSLCSPHFSATQYALLSSLMAASRDILVAPAGAAAQAVGWSAFFVLTVVASAPGLLMLPWLAPWRSQAPSAAPSPQP